MKAARYLQSFVLLWSLWLLASSGWSQAEEHAGLDRTLQPMRHLVEQFVEDRGSLERFYNVSFSTNRTERLRKFLEETQARLERVRFEELDQDGKVDYILLKNQLKFDLAQFAHEEARLKEVDGLLPFRSAVVRLAEARQRVDKIDPSGLASELIEIVRQVEAAQGKLERQLKENEEGEGDAKPPWKKTVAFRAAGVADAIRETLKEWHRFYVGYHPEFSWWAKEPYEKLEKTLEKYATFLREKLVGHKEGEEEPVVGDPIGRDALLEALAYEMVPYSPEELIDIAQKEFAWCEREYKKAAEELGFGDDWRKALTHVKGLHVQPGEQPQLIKSLAHEAEAFLEKRDLLTIPEIAKETWRMKMMTVERQKVNPYFTGGEEISVSFPTDGMTHTDKLMSLRGNNIHFSRATVHHELIPGHHLQIFMSKRYRTHRRVFRTAFLVEGWALYWEMLLWDLGFPKSAEDRIGFLFWRSHRCARIIFSLSFHLGKMSAEEAIEFLIERVGHEHRNATAEVRRSVQGDYNPLYQAAYMLGGLQIRAMRKELVESGKMTDREFHDAILRENSIPVAMIRASLTEQPLRRDFKSDWRFYQQ